jgi:Tfp pilus assembly protein FimT
MPNRNNWICEKGVSIHEMVVTLAIIGLLISVAVPSFSSLTQAQNKRAAREAFEAFLKEAQATAIKNGARYVLTARASGANYAAGTDYPPYNSPVNPDSTAKRLNFPKNITIVAATRIVFDARGQLVDSAGLPTSSTITMSNNGSIFATATLYSTGAFIYN